VAAYSIESSTEPCSITRPTPHSLALIILHYLCLRNVCAVVYDFQAITLLFFKYWICFFVQRKTYEVYTFGLPI